MKVLSNCTVTKLREYSKSYGTKETLNFAYIKEFDKEIWLLNECGEHIRTLRKNTKLLLSFEGKEITLRQLNTRCKKAVFSRSIAINERLAKQKEIEGIFNAENKRQLILWGKFINENPESKAKYIQKIQEKSSSKWRNYLRMKAAKHINNEEFKGMVLSPSQLKDILYK